jgi:hypothetical protein
MIFVSSTSDLAEERRALAAGLSDGFDVYLFENDRARAVSPEKHCREMIEKSHVFICLLGGSFGSVYSLQTSNAQSIVEWELGVARATTDVVIMPFEKDPIDQADPRQLDFLNRLRSFGQGVWLKSFNGPGNVVGVVRNSLNAWLVEFFMRAHEAQQRLRVAQSGKMRWLAIVVVALLAALVISPLRHRFNGLSLGVASILVFCVVLLTFLFERRSHRV